MKLRFFSVLFLLSSFGLKAQIYPLLFSESYFPVSSNPASAGVWNDFHVHTTGQIHNFKIGIPLSKTLQFNMGYKIKGHHPILQFLNRNGISVGLNHFNDVIGEDFSNYQNTSFSINKKIKLNKFNLNIGYSQSYFKIVYNSIEYGKLKDSRFMSDFGTLLYNDKFYAGFTLNNAFKPVFNLNPYDFYTEHFISAHVGYKFSFSNFSIMPTMVYQYYGYQIRALYTQVYFSIFNELITLGGGVALKNNFLFSVASQYKNYRFSYHYGTYNSVLSTIYVGRQHEVKLSFFIKENKNRKLISNMNY